MAILNFPTSPNVNDTYSFGGKTWVWNGQGWQLQTQGAINGIVIGNTLPSAGTFTTVSVTANITGGNLLTGGLVSATGNVTGAYILGNAAFMTGIPVSYGNANVVANLAALGSNPISTTGNITGGNIIGTIVGGAITGTTVSATGNVTGGNILTGGLISATGNIDGGNLSGTSIVGTLTTASQTNITSVGTLTSLNSGTISSSGNVTGANINTGGLISATGNITSAGNIAGGNLSGTSIAGTLTTASQTNITSVGTLNSLAVTANIAGGNVTTAGQVSATGNITAGNVLGGANVNATTHTGTTVSVTGAITGGSLTVTTGTVTLGNITNGNGNGIGNIGAVGGYFNTGFLKATTAQYADLAEIYAADTQYAPGTVLEFGGTKEVTLSINASSTRIAGVVSTNPAHLMNSAMKSEYTVAVALTGRVPTSVVGTVRKGDMMVSGGGGTAVACAAPTVGTVIGKALQDFDGESGIIEIVVGRV